MKYILLLGGLMFGILGMLMFGYTTFGISMSSIGVFGTLLSPFTEETVQGQAIRLLKSKLTRVDIDTDDEERIISEIRRLRNPW